MESPAGGTVAITATSVANPSDSASAIISILPIAIRISPATYTVAAAGTAQFTATVTNDVKAGGVTWSCTPMSSCGSFNPATTASGAATTYSAPATVPAGGVVMITATSVTDGTASATATATINTSTVIDVAMSRIVPASVAEGKTATLAATVTGDSSNAGVDWSASCGSSAPGACGTFNPATTSSGSTTTYTAPTSLPPANPVTITAASHAYDLDPSLVENAATATMTIGAPVSIAFITQPPASIATTGQVTVSASVTNDTAPGGVTWSVVCSNTTTGACGHVTPYQTADGETATYVAPPVLPGVTVQVRATSTVSPATSVLSGAITVTQSTAHSIAFVPFAPSQLLQGTTVMLNASVTNDPSHAGVDWTVCASGCGFFTTVPAQPAIPAVPPSPGNPGSPYVPPVPAVTATSAPGWPNGVPIPYTAPSVAPEGGSIQITAAATADRLNDAAIPATAAASIAITSDATGPALNGIVKAGTLPVVGASIYLYAAGTAGYASAAVPVSSPNATSAITTDATGSFTIPAGYACPGPGSLMYFVALGGRPGATNSNPNLALMTALGPCSNLSSSPVVVNEVTTLVSASALAPFSGDDPVTGSISYLNIGSPNSNVIGLANAFATVNNLVNITTGQPLYNTLAGNAAVPYIEINTLADILDACAVTSGGSAGDGSVCGSLFADANPLQNFDTGAAPTDTLQAIFDLVKPPDADTTGAPQLEAIYSTATVSAFSPYQPILTVAPHDWSIALNYTSGGGVGGSGSTGSGSSAFALDASGNLWITNTNSNSVSEWTNLGAPISPAVLSGISGGFTPAGLSLPGPIAVDANGYVWIANGNGSLTELNATTVTPVGGSPFYGGGLAGAGAMAIDKSGDIWITNSGTPGAVTEFSSAGIALSPSSGYTNGITDPLPIAADASGDIWLRSAQPGQSGNITFTELNGASGSLMTSAASTYGLPGQAQVAVDASGNLWAPGLCSAWEIVPSTTRPGMVNVTGDAGVETVANPEALAFDGADRLWLASSGGNQCGFTAVSNVSLIDSPDGYSFTSPSLSNAPLFLSIDGAGNLWVLLNNNTVTEFVGVATPAVTPLATAVKNNKLGAKP